MLNKVEINDKVYHFRNNTFTDLIVKGVFQDYVVCEGKEYINKEYKHFTERKFLKVELFKTDNEIVKPLNVKNKWNKLLQINNNMSISLINLYKDYVIGNLELNPFYQRELCWTLEQKVDYIMVIFTRQIETRPTLIMNYFPEDKEGLKEKEVLDGKQRLTTLFDFIEDKFALDNGKYFSDLNNEDRKIILSHNIRYTRIAKLDMKNLTDKDKIELFLEINELGTKMSEEHIKNIKEKFLK